MGQRRAVRAFWFVIGVLACNADPGVEGRSSADWIQQLHAHLPADRARAASALARALTLKPNSATIVNALVGALSDTSEQVRIAAAGAIATDGVDIGPAADAMHAMLHDSTHSRVRESMIVLVGLLGPGRAGPLIHALAEGLDDPEESVRTNAVDAFGSIGIVRPGELTAILRLANDSSPWVRLSVIRALVPLKVPATTINAVASVALRDSSALVRAAAGYSLARIGPAAAPSLGLLMSTLGDPDASTRIAALAAISQMGTSARDAIPIVTRLQNDPDKNVARAAGEALIRISGM